MKTGKECVCVGLVCKCNVKCVDVGYVCRQVSKVAGVAAPAVTVAARNFHVSPTQKAAEISTILEERILGAAPKVSFKCYINLLLSISISTWVMRGH